MNPETFLLHPLDATARVSVATPMPDLAADLDAQVGQLWQAAVSRVAAGGAGRLFNGRVFSADRITPTAIAGHLTEFRRIVAQMEDPSLFGLLRLRPLAVCGVLLCADGIPIGRRHPGAIYQPGMWQLPPAGSVDSGAVAWDGSVDLRAQVLAELTEELGVDAADVTAVRPLCLIEHPGSHVCDVGMAMTTALTGAAVLAAHRAHGNAEYSRVEFVRYTDLARFVADAGDTLVPPAQEFLRHAGLPI